MWTCIEDRQCLTKSTCCRLAPVNVFAMTSSFIRLFSSFTPSMIKRRSIENVTPASSLKLPRLPIPSLRHTLNGYLKSLEPFILEDEARSEVSFQTTMDKYKARADQFEQGLGQLCQQRLLGPSSSLYSIKFVCDLIIYH